MEARQKGVDLVARAWRVVNCDVQKDNGNKKLNVSCNRREEGLSHDQVDGWVTKDKWQKERRKE